MRRGRRFCIETRGPAERPVYRTGAAEDDPDFRSEIPAFVAEIKTIFERWQLAEYLEKARETEPFDPSIYEDSEEAKMERQADIRRCATDLMLVERAKEWLVEENGE